MGSRLTEQDIVGRYAKIVGANLVDDPLNQAHICLDIDDGPRVFITVAWPPELVLEAEPNPSQPSPARPWTDEDNPGASYGGFKA